MHTAQLPITNIAAYKFVALQNLIELRDELRTLTFNLGLRGTILLSSEGINLFVAGDHDSIDSLLTRVRQISGVEDLEVKLSFSHEQPFNRMLVKIKQEIIAFGIPEIDPRHYTSRRLSAQELKRWLDEGRPVTLLDTRNDFEVETGTFRNAVAIGVEDFRDFPTAVARLPEDLKQSPVVTFCTGGIRCEKAAPYLERAGFQDVYQLDGGILKYFEECGGAHYDGACFVFDKRVALDPELKACNLKYCFACRAVLSPEDLQSPTFIEGQSCPHCHVPESTSRTRQIAERQKALRKLTSTLPGSVAYDNDRPMSVPLRLDGMELLDFLDAMHTHLTRADWIQACGEGRLTCRGVAVQPGRIVRAGERLFHREPATLEPDVATEIEILAEDDALVVVNKPAPLPMHPCGRFNRNTLSYLLDAVYRPLHLRPAHRLDADTTGVVLFCKTRQMARMVQPQFETGTVNKVYLARIQGHPLNSNFTCDASVSAEPGPSGVRIPDPDGVPACTRFRVLEKREDGTSLVEVLPITGRTNQIRVHLWHLGWPIVGDPIYLPQHQLGNNQALSIEAPPLCLHAASLELTHPVTQQRITFVAPAPSWS